VTTLGDAMDEITQMVQPVLVKAGAVGNEANVTAGRDA
jgi:hypothetical protein